MGSIFNTIGTACVCDHYIEEELRENFHSDIQHLNSEYETWGGNFCDSQLPILALIQQPKLFAELEVPSIRTLGSYTSIIIFVTAT